MATWFMGIRVNGSLWRSTPFIVEVVLDVLKTFVKNATVLDMPQLILLE